MFDPNRRTPPRHEDASGVGPKGRTPVDEDATEVLGPEEVRAPVPVELKPGDQFGDYVLEKTIGDGGGGIVFAARHKSTGGAVAIKVLRPEMAALSKMVTRFVREAEAVNRLRHPNIVTLLDFGEIQPGRPYCVMELLEGMDLGKYLYTHGRFSPRKCLALFEPILSAVSAAHKAGLVHRDIKASNVFMAQVDGQPVVKLLDFGIAKNVNHEPGKDGLTEPGTRLGTAHNMPPEQIRCEPLDARADIYALGVLMFQMLTGHYPFEAEDSLQVSWLHLTSPAPAPSLLGKKTPPALDAVVLRCLEKRPENRFQSVEELLDALRAAVAQARASERPAK